MNNDMEQMVQRCEHCQRYQRQNQHEPLTYRDLPDSPWQTIAADLFYFIISTYFLIVDYFSKYVELQPMASACTEAVITAMKVMCARFAVSDGLACGNGPPFNAAKFKTFLTSWDIIYNPSSLYYARSNGRAQRSIKTIKHALQKAIEDGKYLFAVLMDVRSTPMDGLKSPAELLKGRKIRTLVPINSTQLQPHHNCIDAQSHLQFRQERQHRLGDKRTKAPGRTSERLKSVVSALWQVVTRAH
ncbi:uncharacterized protein K02A2.6-like [Ixodes scapularis]|uniref:uncharacterized protein K02A2.6-like n=1 Tax=Ixodes scapularis TaxID=6945 RepID=UPI001A9E7AEA|nr:uncharacterized protein K02A2.6-like [Ixodes scapularis]